MAITAAGTITLVLLYGLAMLLQAAGQLHVQAYALPTTLAVEIAALYVLVPRLETHGAGSALAIAGVYVLLIVLGLLRAEVVTLLSDGLGPRFAPLARRIGQLITRLRFLAP